jgi:hypothetical protein
MLAGTGCSSFCAGLHVSTRHTGRSGQYRNGIDKYGIVSYLYDSTCLYDDAAIDPCARPGYDSKTCLYTCIYVTESTTPGSASTHTSYHDLLVDMHLHTGEKGWHVYSAMSSSLHQHAT